MMDRYFNCLIPDFPEINTNPTATSEHLLEIERQIGVIKERARSIRIKLPFQNLPKGIIIELMNFVVMWLNAFPVNSGAPTTYSPHTFMTGKSLVWTKH